MKKRNSTMAVFLKKTIALTMATTMVLTGTGGLNFCPSLSAWSQEVDTTAGGENQVDSAEEESPAVSSEDLNQTMELSFGIHWEDEENRGGFRPDSESVREKLLSVLKAHPLTGKNSGSYNVSVDDLEGRRQGIKVSVTESGSHWEVTYSNVPVFILAGTGNQTTSNGDNTYQVDSYRLDLAALSVLGYKTDREDMDFGVHLESQNDVSFISDHPQVNLSLDMSLFAETFQRTVTWNDNVDVNGYRPKDIDFLSLHYIVEGKERAILSSSASEGEEPEGVDVVTEKEAKEELGALDASVFTPNRTTPQIDTHWNLEWKYLPKTDPNGNEISYFLCQRQVPQRYLSSLGNAANVRVEDQVTYTYSDRFSVTVTWNDAAEKEHRLKDIKDLDLSIYQISAGKTKKIYNTKEEVPSGLKDSDIEWPASCDGDSWTLTVPSLKGYSENNATNTYYVTVKAPTKIEGEDWTYDVTYDNGLSSNETKRAYANGAVLINLDGESHFEATKVFQVVGLDRSVAASKVSFRLWCYPDNKTADAMSAVTVGGNQLTWQPKESDIVSCDTGEYKKKGYDKIDLKDSSFSDKPLERYDALGYKLKYCVTEDPTDVYQAVYPEGTEVLENGQTMSNILSHQKMFKVRKIWNSQGYGAYKKTSVTLELQKSLDGKDWSYAGRRAVFSGFTSSVTAKEKALSPVSKYEDGQELKYRVIEKLEYNGKPVTIKNWVEQEGVLSATYELDGKEYIATIRQDQDTFTVFNEVSSDLTIHLKKLWKNSDSAAWGEEDKKDGTKIIRKKRGFVLNLYRSRQGETTKLYAKVKVSVAENGSVTVTAEDGSGEALSPVKAYTSDYSQDAWDLIDLALPRSDEGYVYDYHVTEDFPKLEGAGVYQAVNYKVHGKDEAGLKAGDMTVTATNSIYSGDGEYHEIYVKKKWNDNSDVESRGSVTATVGIWEKKESGWKFTKASEFLENDISAVLDGENNYARIVNVTDLYIPGKYKELQEGERIAGALKNKSEKIRLGVTETDILYDGIRFPQRTGYTYEEKVSGENGKKTWIVEGTIAGGMLSSGQLRSGYDYSVEEEEQTYTITNTKSGKVDISSTIEWKDGGYGKYRQYGWGVALYYVDRNGKELPFVGEDGKQLVEEDSDESVTAENAYKTSEEPVKGEDGKNCYRYRDLIFSGLPMYDNKGRAYTYSVHEYIKDKDGNRMELTITDPKNDLKRTHYQVTGDNDGVLEPTATSLVDSVLTQQYGVKFHHKAGGTSVDTTYYTLWYDQARIEEPQTYGRRVHAAYQLFYKMSDEKMDALQPYTQRMVRNTVSAEEGADNTYYQKVMFSGMPEFDEEGNHYEYFAQQELLNNPAGDAGYTTEYYEKSLVKKNPKVEKTGTPAFDLEEETIASECKENGVTGVRLPENGLFVNRIHGRLKINGTKEWKDMPDDTGVMGYPDIEISLSKRSDYDRDDTAIPATINKARSRYSFLTEDGEEREFEKFDRYGAVYIYSLKEKMYLPGTKKRISSHLYHSLMNGEMKEDDPYDVTGDRQLNNYYSVHGANRDICIHKTWGADMPEDGNPKAVFRLYRSPVDIADMTEEEDGGASTVAKIVKNKEKLRTLWNKKEEVDAVTFVYDKDNPQQTKTLKDLPLYASNGQLYLYFMEEDTSLDSEEGLPGFQAEYDEKDTGYRLFTDGKNTGRIVFTNQNISTGRSDLGNTGKEVETIRITDDVHVKNTFDTDTVKEICGVKDWKENTADLVEEDRYSSFIKENIRPKVSHGSLPGVTLGLTQILDGKTEEIKADQYQITWQEEEGVYTYSIKPVDGATFPKYNKDGKAYIYQVTEEMSHEGSVETNYKGTEKVSKNAALADAKNVLKMEDLTNTLQGSVKVNKWWNDGRDAYLLRDVQLQIDLVACKEGESDPLFVLCHNMSKADKWVYTFKELPLVDQQGNRIVYKIRERKIGEDQVEDLKTSREEKGFIFQGRTNNYQVSYQDYDGLFLTPEKPAGSTEITNKLTGTSLTIVKKWEGDSSDFYARPGELRFKLQYRVAKWKESDGKVTGFEENWQDSSSNTGSSDTSVIITLKEKDQDPDAPDIWKKTVANLPKTIMVDGVPRFVQYRAVELDRDADGRDTELKIGDSMDSYLLTKQDDHLTDNLGRDAGDIVSKTELVNRYVSHENMTVYRFWNDNTLHDTRVALYSTNFERGDKKAGEAAATVVKDGRGRSTVRTLTKGDENLRSVTYEHLPMYNRDQKKIHYYVGEVAAAGKEVFYDSTSRLTRTKEEKGISYRTRYYEIRDGKVTRELEDSAVSGKTKNTLTECTEDNNRCILVENTPLICVKVSKNWKDEAADRPEEVSYVLLQKKGDQKREMEIQRVAVTKDSSEGTASYTWRDLPTHEEISLNAAPAVGEEITYEVDEKEVPLGYKKTVSALDEKTFVITNTMETDDLEVHKTWKNEKEASNLKKVDHVTFKLMRKVPGGDYSEVFSSDKRPVTIKVYRKEENATDTGRITGLPRYNSEGKPYQYCAIETSLTYKKEGEDSSVTVEAISGDTTDEGIIGEYRYSSKTTSATDETGKTFYTTTAVNTYLPDNKRKKEEEPKNTEEKKDKPSGGGGGSAGVEPEPDEIKKEEKPEDSKPKDKKPEDSRKEDKKPEDSKPEDKKPEDKKPEDSEKKGEKTEDSKKDEPGNKDPKPRHTKKKTKDAKSDSRKESKKDSRKDASEDTKKDGKKKRKRKTQTIRRKTSEEEDHKKNRKSKKRRKEEIDLKGYYDYMGVWHPVREVPKTKDRSPILLFIILATVSFGYLTFGALRFLVKKPGRSTGRNRRRR